MEHVLLSMQHISKSYPGVQALDDVSLRLEPQARSWRWPGENGSRKSNAYEDPVRSVTPRGGTICLTANSL